MPSDQIKVNGAVIDLWVCTLKNTWVAVSSVKVAYTWPGYSGSLNMFLIKNNLVNSVLTDAGKPSLSNDNAKSACSSYKHIHVPLKNTGTDKAINNSLIRIML